MYPPRKVKQPESVSVMHWIFVFFLCVLFMEWLYPLPILTDTHSISLFGVFFAFVLIMKTLRVPVLVHVLLGFIAMLYSLHQLYVLTLPVWDIEWMVLLVQEIGESIARLIEGNTIDHSPFVRSFFFFGLVWYVALFLFRLLAQKRRLVGFVLLTILYIAILDTFTSYSGHWPIIRTVSIGCMLIAGLRLHQVQNQVPDESEYKRDNRLAYRWIIASLVFTFVVTSISFIGPKAEPLWPDPVPFIQAHTDRWLDDIGTAGRVGYGDSDEQLGGPFIQDDSLVFRAEGSQAAYWRGESKDTYTGQGWEQAAYHYTEFHPNAHHLFDRAEVGLVEGNARWGRPMQARVEMATNHVQQLFYPGAIDQLHMYPQPNHLVVDRNTGRIQPYTEEGALANVGEYIVEGYEMTWTEEDLQHVSLEGVPQPIMDTYTQLPDSLPERVHELAAEITADSKTLYEQVREVERYFRRSGYVYETDDVPYPNRGQDFVDQFLFDTQAGYCDHFSTAMIVLLRAQDIPARWVKGFTAGDQIQQGDSSSADDVHEVRNKHAHSWVEVYFPGQGWVPFEPTRTFSNTQITGDSSGASTEPTDHLDESEYEQPETDSEEPSSSSTNDQREGAASSWTGISSFTIPLLVVGGISIVAGIGYYYRRLLIKSWLLARFRRKQDNFPVDEAYPILLRYLGRWVLPKKPGQTSREYISRLQPHMDTTELEQLTRTFETMRYGSFDNYSTAMQKQQKQAYSEWMAVIRKIR